MTRLIVFIFLFTMMTCSSGLSYMFPNPLPTDNPSDVVVYSGYDAAPGFYYLGPVVGIVAQNSSDYLTFSTLDSLYSYLLTYNANAVYVYPLGLSGSGVDFFSGFSSITPVIVQFHLSTLNWQDSVYGAFPLTVRRTRYLHSYVATSTPDIYTPSPSNAMSFGQWTSACKPPGASMTPAQMVQFFSNMSGNTQKVIGSNSGIAGIMQATPVQMSSVVSMCIGAACAFLLFWMINRRI